MAEAALHANLGLMNLAWRRLLLCDSRISTTVVSGGVMMEGEGNYVVQLCRYMQQMTLCQLFTFHKLSAKHNI